MKSLIIGDHTFIDRASRFLLSSLEIGDYGKIHNHALFMGAKGCKIGHNFWLGEYSTINTFAPVTIGNNVQIGKNAHIWTHASCDMLEGCMLNIKKSVVIEDNVWLAGNYCTINPGVRLAEGSIVLTHSVVTKDTEQRRVYGGVPAKDITDKMNIKPYQILSIEQKYQMMKGFVKEFLEENPDVLTGDIIFATDNLNNLLKEKTPKFPVYLKGVPSIVITTNPIPKWTPKKTSVFTVLTKEYTKKNTPIEIRFMKFLVGYRGKFLPVDE